MLMLSDCVHIVLNKQAVLLLSHLFTHVKLSLVAITQHTQQSLVAVVIADSTIVKWTAFNRCLLALKLVTLSFTLLFVCISVSIPPCPALVLFVQCVDFL